MSFGREKYEREARFSMEKYKQENEYKERSGSPLRDKSNTQSVLKNS